MSVDVQHALHVAEVMEDNGVSCRAVYGDMDIDERRETLEAFAAGEIRALTNCQLLTEGWDSPDLGAVLMARPTKSKVLYIQCVGRAYGRRRARRTVCSSILWTSRISMTSVPLEPWRETPASSRARGKLFFRLQMSGVGTVAEQNERGQKIFVH
jgi:superfamily II DNA or RNA helicase